MDTSTVSPPPGFVLEDEAPLPPGFVAEQTPRATSPLARLPSATPEPVLGPSLVEGLGTFLGMPPTEQGTEFPPLAHLPRMAVPPTQGPAVSFGPFGNPQVDPAAVAGGVNKLAETGESFTSLPMLLQLGGSMLAGGGAGMVRPAIQKGATTALKTLGSYFLSQLAAQGMPEALGEASVKLLPKPLLGASEQMTAEEKGASAVHTGITGLMTGGLAHLLKTPETPKVLPSIPETPISQANLRIQNLKEVASLFPEDQSPELALQAVGLLRKQALAEKDLVKQGDLLARAKVLENNVNLAVQARQQLAALNKAEDVQIAQGGSEPQGRTFEERTILGGQPQILDKMPGLEETQVVPQQVVPGVGNVPTRVDETRGKISFGSPAEAGAIPSARQAAIRPLVSVADAFERAGKLPPEEPQAGLPVEVPKPPTPSAPSYQVTVQPKQGEVPGYVQVDEVVNGKNTRSLSLDEAKGLGLNVENFEQLPGGRYSYDEAVAKVKGGEQTNAEGLREDTGQAGQDKVTEVGKENSGQDLEQQTSKQSGGASQSVIIPGLDPQSIRAMVNTAKDAYEGGKKFAEWAKMQAKDVKIEDLQKVWDSVKAAPMQQEKKSTPLMEAYKAQPLTPVAHEVLLDPKEIGFGDITKDYDGTQILNRLKNKVGSTEWNLLEAAGIRSEFDGKQVSPLAISRWVQENGLKTEVHSYGMAGKVSEARKEYDKMTHEWLEQLSSGDRTRARRGDYRLLKPDDIAKAERYNTLRKQLENEPRDTSPRATSAYDTASALPTNEPMPEWTSSKSRKNVQRVDVVIPGTDIVKGKDATGFPTREYQGKEPLWRADNLHEQLPNTLGWAMIQYKTGPKGEKIAVIVEAQSRWGQELRKSYDEMVKRGATPEEAKQLIKENKAYAGVVPTPDHPLLRDYNRLILKAAIEQARKEGATHIMVSDAETAMMTEGHDQSVHINTGDYEVPELRNIDARYTGKIHVEGGQYQFAIDAERQTGGMLRLNPQEEAFTIAKKQLLKSAQPKQEPGMRLHYDKTYWTLRDSKGNLVKDAGIYKTAEEAQRNAKEGQSPVEKAGALNQIAEKLTGSKGEKVSLGDHKNAYGNKPTGNGWVDTEGQPSGKLRENLIFRNPDGTPKTDVSGMMYPLDKVSSVLEKQPFTLTGTDKLIQRLEGLKVRTERGVVYANPIPGISKAVWNTGIDLAIGLVKAGRSIEEAISRVLDHWEKNKEGKFDRLAAERQIRDALSNAPKTEPTETKKLAPVGTEQRVAQEKTILQKFLEKHFNVQTVDPGVMDSVTPAPVQTLDAFGQAIQDAKKVRGEVEVERTVERGRRLATYEQRNEAAGTLEGRVKAFKTSMAGELPKADVDPLVDFLSDEQVQQLSDHLNKHRDVVEDGFRRGNLTTALSDLVYYGKLPQPHQIAWFEKIFGEKVAKALVDKYRKRTAFRAISELGNVFRTSITGYDLSATLKQGFILGVTHPKIALTGFKAQLHAFADKEYARAFMRELNSGERAEIRRVAGLQQTTFEGKLLSDMTNREEQFSAHFWQRLADVRGTTKLGKTLAALPVTHARILSASERAFVTHMNWLRATIFDLRDEQLQKMYEGKELDNNRHQLAKLLNAASGRANVATTELINTLAFAFKYKTSRFEYPVRSGYYAMTKKGPVGAEARRQVVAQATYFAAMGLLMNGAAQSFGFPVTLDLDPRSTNFLRIKIKGKHGFTTIDQSGGIGNAVRYVMQFFGGQRTDDKGKPQKVDPTYLAGQFVRSSLAPLGAASWDVAKHRDMQGQKPTVGTVAEQLVTPITLQNVDDFMREWEGAGLALMVPEILGQSVSVPTQKKP